MRPSIFDALDVEPPLRLPGAYPPELFATPGGAERVAALLQKSLPEWMRKNGYGIPITGYLIVADVLDDEAIARAKERGARQDALTAATAERNWRASDLGDVLVVYDASAQLGGKTVTNQADEVIDALRSVLGELGTRRVIYCDTEGVFDELKHEGGRFTGFLPIRETRLARALEKVRAAPP